MFMVFDSSLFQSNIWFLSLSTLVLKPKMSNMVKFKENWHQMLSLLSIVLAFEIAMLHLMSLCTTSAWIFAFVMGANVVVLLVNFFVALGFTVSCFEAQEVKLHRHFLPVYFDSLWDSVKLNRNDKFPKQNEMGFLLEWQSHLSCRKVGSNFFCTLATVRLHSHPEETFHLLLVYRSSTLVRCQVPKWEPRGWFEILVCCFFD